MRLIDLIVSLVALILLLPVFLLVAIAIKLDSRGPVFYSQLRVGRRGRTFGVHKFRSMVIDAERLGPPLTGSADPRVTRVGKFLRLVRLDELPQLLNVLKGEMSLVGPRPEVPSVVEQYTPEQREVLEVKPGITGPTQLSWLDESERYPSGVDPYQHYNEHFIHEKLQSDLEYVRTRSVRKDLWLLIQTPLVIAKTILERFHPYPTTRQIARLAADCLAVAVANLAAFMIRFDGEIPKGVILHLLFGLPVTCMAYLLSFLVLKTYRSLWRFVGIEDLWQVIKAPALGGSLAALALFLLGWTGYPRSVLLLTALLTVLFTGGMRLAVRSSVKRRMTVPANGNRRNIVIVGAGKTGESVAREIRSNPALGCDLIGFVDDDLSKQGATIHGLPVLGTIERLPELTLAHAIQEAFIAIPAATGTEMRRISGACARASLNFKTLPSLTQLMQGDGKVRYLRKSKTDDLLRRKATLFNEVKILECLRGKRVMVTGAGGFVGSELCRQVLRFGAESLIMVERVENALHDISLQIRGRYPNVRLTPTLADIKHIPRMSEIFQRLRPQVVFHTAAYKHVPMLEDQPGEAVLNNIVATKRLAEVARKFDAETLVVLSSHKAVGADSLMGATKKISEMYITALNRAMSEPQAQAGRTRFTVVRFGNVLGSPGSVVPLFQKQIEDGHPITITDPEASRLFMTVSEAVGLVLESASTPIEGDVFVLNMGEPVKIGELAEDLALSLGLSPSEVTRKSVGLRPGDKVQEPLWEDGEEVLPTDNERILAIRQRPKSLPEMEVIVGELETLAMNGNVAGLLEKIHEVVPTYHPSHKAPQSAVFGAGEKCRILVIDDDKALGEMLEGALNGTFKVAKAHSAREGFDQIHFHAPHLILLDVKLPDESGNEVCRRLREDAVYRRIPIIMITGYGDKDSVVTGLRAGADDYLSKPFKLNELQARIEAVLRRKIWN